MKHLNRALIILLTLFASTPARAQTVTFETTVAKLYFGVDIKKAAAALVDTLLTVSALHHNDTVVKQSNLNITMQLGGGKDAWEEKHIFTFNKSPLPGVDIQSGYIIVTIGAAPGVQKLLDVNWRVAFDNKAAAEKFYNKLVEIFAPVSTKQKTESVKDVGLIAQYSTRNTNEKGIRDIAFSFAQSLQTKKYEITFSLGNEFMDE